jgi:uncharacterized membrane protein
VIDPLPALAMALVVGGVATVLAIRWAGRAIAVLGLLGAVVSPLLVGAPSTAETVALLAVAVAGAMAVVVWQRWDWMGVAAILLSAPQLAIWTAHEQRPGAQLVGLVVFAGLGLAGALGCQARITQTQIRPPSAALVVLNACVVALIGRTRLAQAGYTTAGEAWLVALGAVHVVLGLARTRRLPLADDMCRLLLATGVTIADVAFGLAAHGPVLALGWGAGAVLLAWFSRRARERDVSLLGLGAGAHLALVLMRVAVDAPPGQLGRDDPQLVALISVAALAASCLATARFVGEHSAAWREWLHAAALAAIAYLTASAFAGPVLVVIWSAEAIALAQVARGSDDRVGRLGPLGFLALAALYALALEAPPSSLVLGADDLGSAAISLAAVLIAAARLTQLHADQQPLRTWLGAGTAAVALYLPSVAIVTVFRPASGPLLDLGIAQQGQMLLSACWSLAGLLGLLVGLRRQLPIVRNAALGLLLAAVAKVFLYDLSELTSIYRVLSFVVVGLLLLAGAFAYQRLRPPAAPDMRTVPRSER